MRRGFKAEAERVAGELRAKIGCSDDESIDLVKLAEELGLGLVSAAEHVSLDRLEELHELQAGAFSAGTFSVGDGQRVVVYNPLHSAGRTRSDQAHELAHIILNHKVRTVETVGDLKLLTCDAEQEEEANWLAGCLLLPRPLLLKCAQRGMTPERIAAKYETSEDMARFRLNTSGVLIQIGRSRSARK